MKEGWKAELGATYIHGIDSNPIYKVAEANDLLRLGQRDLKGGSVLALTEGGEEVNPKIVQEVDWHYGMLMQECEEFFTHQRPTPVDSVGQFMRKEMATYLSKYSGRDRRLREILFTQRLLHEACLCGSDELMDDVALSELGE